jgi:spore germination cell wall hydrolase CwlJ-like protein
VNIHANANKTTTDNHLKIITMRPINDDFANTQDIAIYTPKKSTTKETNAVASRSVAHKSSPQELKCLTQTIYFEAKSEGYDGGAAVGNVIMNRVKSGKFPNTICGVMKQKTGKMCQFSFMCNGQINQKVNAAQWKQSEKIALDILSGKAPKLSKGALFFHAKYSKLRLASNRYTAKIGQHYFYK